MVVERWSDDRLDELNRRLINVENVATTVAVLQSESVEMKRSLGRVEQAVEGFSTKLGQVVDEPMVRARDFRSKVLQGLIAAVAGGVIVFLATLAAGAIH